MPSSDELPEKCMECAKSKVSHPRKTCRFGNKLDHVYSPGVSTILARNVAKGEY